MKLNLFALKKTCALLITACAFTGLAQAADYPSKSIRIMVPWSAGTGTDLNARVIAQKITDGTRQTAIVENRPGAGGIVGSGEVLRAPADGYTVLATSNAHIANLFLVKNLGFDPIKDFEPVSATRKMPSLIIARPGLNVKNLAELTALAKKNPGKISFGAGTSAGRIGMELYQEMTGTKLLHVPYKSATGALTDLMGGHVDVMFVDTFNAMPRLKEGKVVPLAAGSITRLKSLPDLPTADEQGLKGYEMASWSGLWVRKGTPPDVIAVLNKYAREAAQAERANVEAMGGEVFITSKEEFDRFIEAETALWSRLAKAANIVPE